MGPNTTTGGNQIPWSDPNYWSGWNNTLGSLGGAVGQWVDAFSDNGTQPIVYQSPPPTTSNNTMLYIGFGVLALLLIIIIVFLFKKS